MNSAPDMPLRSLAPEQRRVLDLAFAHWVEHGTWPQRAQILASLRAEKADYKTAFSENLWPFARAQDSGPVELTVFGAAMAAGSEHWIKYFVPLVKKASALYLSDPHNRPQLSDAHLRELAPGEPKEKIERIGELYREGLQALGQAAYSANGAWYVDLTISVVKFRRVASVAEFLQRNLAIPRREQQLSDDAKTMVTWTYNKWRETGEAPTAIETVLSHLDLVDPLATWEELPHSLFAEHNLYSQPPQKLQLRLSCLLAIQPASDTDIRKMAEIIFAIRDSYLESGATRAPPLSEVASRVGALREDIVRLLALLPSIPHLGIFLQKNDEDFWLSVSETIFEIDNLQSVDEFLKWVSQRERARDHWATPPAPPVSGKHSMPIVELSGQQLAFHRALTEKSAKLASMYHGALRVLQDDGNPDRLALAAHGLRELMEKLPAHFDVEMPAHRESLGPKVRELENHWKQTVDKSTCRNPDGPWRGEIDRHLTRLLAELAGFFAWLNEHMPKRKEEVSATLRIIDPAKRPLPPQLQKLNVETWHAIHAFFIKVSHHGLACSVEELAQWTDALERFLLDRLVPRTFDDLRAIDAILAESGGSGNG